MKLLVIFNTEFVICSFRRVQAAGNTQNQWTAAE